MSKQEQVAALREAAQSAKKQVPVPVPYSPRAVPGRHSLGECGGVRVFDDYEPVQATAAGGGVMARDETIEVDRAELERLRRVATEALCGYAEVWSLLDRISSEERQMTADEALTIYSLQSETVWEELRARGMDPSAACERRAALRERLAAAEADRAELARLRDDPHRTQRLVDREVAAETRELNAELDALRETNERLTDEIGRLRERLEWMRCAHMLMAQSEMFARAPVRGHGAFVFNDIAPTVIDGEPALYVMCSDTFAYACADAEDATYADAPELLRIAVAEGWPGITRWVQSRRHEKGDPADPIVPVKDRMLAMDKLREENADQAAELARLRRVEARAAHLLRSRGSAAEEFAASALREELRGE